VLFYLLVREAGPAGLAVDGVVADQLDVVDDVLVDVVS
jgi:uncharacterized protein YuzE